MPLKIIIVGAGLAGLGAAISLGREGHEVIIFEKSSFSGEIGAGMHWNPSGHHILRAWGINTADMRPNICLISRRVWDLSIGTQKFDVVFDFEKRFQELAVKDHEIMVHRQDAHRVLREAALAMDNVTLRISSPVSSVNAEKGLIKLADSSEVVGDLIIGADGIHSELVQSLGDPDNELLRSPVNAYRFLVPMTKALADPKVASFLQAYDLETTHSMFMDTGTRKLAVVYVCRDSTLLNIATFLPAEMDIDNFGSTWNTPGSVSHVLESFNMFPEHFLRLFEMAEDVKHWAIYGRRCPRAFVQDRLILIGDAAHPMPATYGAGASIAIEDAAVLGVLFDRHTTVEMIDRRAVLYNEVRYRRACTVKYGSEFPRPGMPSPAEQLAERLPGAELPDDMYAYLCSHDAIQAAQTIKEKDGVTGY